MSGHAIRERRRARSRLHVIPEVRAREKGREKPGKLFDVAALLLKNSFFG
jgi:hypothetical protein